MDQIGIRELRADVATQVRRAGDGHRVIVTVGGRPVAQLGPIEAAHRQTSLADLAARGQVLLARRQDRPDPSTVLPLWAGTRIDQLVREVRGR